MSTPWHRMFTECSCHRHCCNYSIRLIPIHYLYWSVIYYVKYLLSWTIFFPAPKKKRYTFQLLNDIVPMYRAIVTNYASFTIANSFPNHIITLKVWNTIIIYTPWCYTYNLHQRKYWTQSAIFPILYPWLPCNFTSTFFDSGKKSIHYPVNHLNWCITY